MARDDESGQMMLLGAVVLILGFVALGGLVARINQLPAEIGRDQSDPIFLEVEPLAEIVAYLLGDSGVIDQIAPVADPDNGAEVAAHNAAYQAALVNALNHLARLEAGKGYHFDWALCPGVGVVSVLSSPAAILEFKVPYGALSPSGSPSSSPIVSC